MAIYFKIKLRRTRFRQQNNSNYSSKYTQFTNNRSIEGDTEDYAENGERKACNETTEDNDSVTYHSDTTSKTSNANTSKEATIEKEQDGSDNEEWKERIIIDDINITTEMNT